ncbi:MAG: DUF1699 family protein [Methanogenium sp.]|jgi:hypothetical protein
MTEKQPTETISVLIISSREELNEAPAGTIVPNIHMTFRPSGKDILMAISKFNELQYIQVPRSYRASIAEFVLDLLKLRHIVIHEGDVWGHRKDLCAWAYVNVPCEIIEQARREWNTFQ